MVTNLSNEQDRLVGTDAMAAGHARHRRVDFHQAMRAAAGFALGKRYEQGNAGRVLNVIAVKHRHQDRRIEKCLHSPLAFIVSRSSRRWRRTSSVVDDARGWPVRKTHTPCPLDNGP